MTGEAVSFLRYLAGLRGFLRRPLDADECLRRIRDGLERREEHFLTMVENGIYAVAQSPYRALLAHAGVETLRLDDRRIADQFEYGCVDGHADRAISLQRRTGSGIAAILTVASCARQGAGRKAASFAPGRLPGSRPGSGRRGHRDRRGSRRPRRGSLGWA